eukprot:137778-Pyramimonas_sp.AAC.1
MCLYEPEHARATSICRPPQARIHPYPPPAGAPEDRSNPRLGAPSVRCPRETADRKGGGKLKRAGQTHARTKVTLANGHS